MIFNFSHPFFSFIVVVKAALIDPIWLFSLWLSPALDFHAWRSPHFLNSQKQGFLEIEVNFLFWLQMEIARISPPTLSGCEISNDLTSIFQNGLLPINFLQISLITKFYWGTYKTIFRCFFAEIRNKIDHKNLHFIKKLFSFEDHFQKNYKFYYKRVRSKFFQFVREK